MHSKMAEFHHILLFLVLIQTSINAAPSEVPSEVSADPSLLSKLEDIADVQTADVKLDQPVTLEDASKTDNDATQGQRQKRFYNYYGFGYPPMNPVLYPNFVKRDDPGFGADDPLGHIYRRLQDIAGAVRNQNFNQPPPPPPPLPSFPILFPVIYIPQVGCGCTPSQPRPKPPRNNGTEVDIANRFPEMEDERQNWGLVVNQNETEADDGQEEDFTRPISFVPIEPIRPSSRPPPPVEHGTSQSGQGAAQSGPTTTTTVSPPSNAPANSPVPSDAPTACDAAILSCCHQPQVTYDCFVVQGCPDPTSYGNPCESRTIFSVINKFQRFYGQRAG